MFSFYKTTICLVIEKNYFREIFQLFPESFIGLIESSDSVISKDNAILFYVSKVTMDGNVYLQQIFHYLTRNDYDKYHLVSFGEETEDVTDRGGFKNSPFEVRMARNIQINFEGGKEFSIKSFI